MGPGEGPENVICPQAWGVGQEGEWHDSDDVGHWIKHMDELG